MKWYVCIGAMSLSTLIGCGSPEVNSSAQPSNAVQSAGISSYERVAKPSEPVDVALVNENRAAIGSLRVTRSNGENIAMFTLNGTSIEVHASGADLRIVSSAAPEIDLTNRDFTEPTRAMLLSQSAQPALTKVVPTVKALIAVLSDPALTSYVSAEGMAHVNELAGGLPAGKENSSSVEAEKVYFCGDPHGEECTNDWYCVLICWNHDAYCAYEGGGHTHCAHP